MAGQITGGYTGKVLRVNLSDNHTSIEELDGLFCRKYFGGAGFIAYYLVKELKQGIEALSPENTWEIFPGLRWVGIAANTAFAGPHMAPSLGSMLLSDEKVALELIRRLKYSKV